MDGQFGRFQRLQFEDIDRRWVLLPETVTLVAAMSVAPSTARVGVIDTLIRALQAGGVWSKLDLLYVMAAHDSQAARLNWKNPATFTLSLVNSPTFTTDRGYAGNGSTSYLATGWDTATNGVNYKRDDAYASAYTIDGGATNGGDFGTLTGTSVLVKTGANARTIRINQGTGLNGGAVTSPVQIAGIRRDSANCFLFANGLQDTTSAVASGALSTVDLTIGSAGSSFSDRRNACVSAGAALSDAQALADYNAKRAYLQAVGAVP